MSANCLKRWPSHRYKSESKHSSVCSCSPWKINVVTKGKTREKLLFWSILNYYFRAHRFHPNAENAANMCSSESFCRGFRKRSWCFCMPCSNYVKWTSSDTIRGRPLGRLSTPWLVDLGFRRDLRNTLPSTDLKSQFLLRIRILQILQSYRAFPIWNRPMVKFTLRKLHWINFTKRKLSIHFSRSKSLPDMSRDNFLYLVAESVGVCAWLPIQQSGNMVTLVHTHRKTSYESRRYIFSDARIEPPKEYIFWKKSFADLRATIFRREDAAVLRKKRTHKATQPRSSFQSFLRNHISSFLRREEKPSQGKRMKSVFFQ